MSYPIHLGPFCDEKCIHLSVRNYGRDCGWRCNLFNIKLVKFGYPHVPTYRCKQCLEVVT